MLCALILLSLVRLRNESLKFCYSEDVERELVKLGLHYHRGGKELEELQRLPNGKSSRNCSDDSSTQRGAACATG
jgi:hypothetical protein